MAQTTPVPIETTAPSVVEGCFRGEAPLSELLRDPIACALMVADKTNSSVVYGLLRTMHRAG